MSSKNSFISKIFILFIKAFAHILWWLPARLIEYFAYIGGVILWDVFRVRRKVTTQNIETMFAFCNDHPEMRNVYLPSEHRNLSSQSVSLIGRRSLTSLLLSLVECLVEWIKPGTSRVTFHNVENFSPGTLLLCSHMANWELLAAIVTKSIRPARTIVKEAGLPTLTEVLRQFRKDVGFLAIEKKKDIIAVRQILRSIKDGEAVGFVMDQFRPADHIVPLFGRITRTNSTLARLHLQTSAPIIPVWMRRKKLFVFDVYFEKALKTVDECETAEERIILQTAEINRVLEGMICQNPDEYFWQHRRFKM